MTKTEERAICALATAIYDELAELHNAVDVLADTVAALNAAVRRMASIDYDVEDNDITTIA